MENPLTTQQNSVLKRQPSAGFPCFLACLAVMVYVGFAPGEDWPQWRGPGRDGVWPAQGLPDRLSDGLKARWRAPLGGGYGGIAVVQGRVYVMDRQTMPRDVERVLCLSSKDGSILWQHEYAVDYNRMDYGNGPRSTPLVAGDRVYTFGAVGHLCCLDATKGKLLWQRDTVKELKGRIPTWGHACSPLLDGERLIVQVGGEPTACLVAFDKDTGKEIWRALPDRPGYSSPIFIDTKGGRQLVYWTAEHLNGLDLATGKVLWQVPHETEYDVTITDPVYHDGVLLVSDYWKGSKAVALDDQGRNPRILWQGRRLSQLMCTPLVRDGHVYALDRAQGLKCIELKTGTVKWEGEHVTPKDRNPQASLVWCGEQALIFNTPGELLLTRLTPTGCELRGKVAILDRTWAHPSFAEGCIFARNDQEIVCVPLLGR